MKKTSPKKRTAANRMTANQCHEALARRHANDVFVPECKDGPTHGANHFRVDAWAMARSWAHPCMVGYEIKVSRSDFLGDVKWRAYLPLCNQFYFACPPKLIDPSELDDDVGLVYCYAGPSRVRTVKKAKHRVIERGDTLVTMLEYVLMCRAKIARYEWEIKGRRDASEWREFVATNAEYKDLGRSVAIKINKLVDARVGDLEGTNRLLKRENEKYAELIDWLKANKIDIHSYRARDQILSLNDIVDKQAIRSLELARDNILRVIGECRSEASAHAEA
jgi:hypothetical protein